MTPPQSLAAPPQGLAAPPMSSAAELPPHAAIPGLGMPLPRGSRLPRPDSHVLALEEVRLHGLERASVLGALLLVALALAWAALTRVPEVAVGAGEVVPLVATAPVQHLEGGIVAAVLVAEGEMVEAGQPLVRLNAAAAEADLAQLALRHESLLLQAQRLAAAIEGRPDAMPGAMPGTPSGRFAAPQRAALESRLRALADRRAVLREQAAQKRNDLDTLSGQIAALGAQIQLHSTELATREGLARSGLTTRLAVLEARRLAMGATAERDRLVGQLASARRSLAEAEARITETQSSATDEARQEAAKVALEIAETGEAMHRLEDRAGRTVVRAPIAGILRGLAVHRPGAVVQPGGLLAEVMPREATLVADVRLTPRDIGFIKVGQTVHLKVQAFDYARFGAVAGVVERVSAGTFLDEQRQPHYRARIVLDQQYVGRDPQFARLAAGMTVQADITTGDKTVLQYLLKPIYSAMATSFQER